ncbi:unnamed protein product [Clonostachys chloroleuca]|uniref:Uncharacterized protein n=1 Tax=Clonostachys chloroleuca TaxID=1926264 RepID=A0AA35VF25_9HYPO|nr:unnamed protein product [Clonostachys chloroleuca]
MGLGEPKNGQAWGALPLLHQYAFQPRAPERLMIDGLASYTASFRKGMVDDEWRGRSGNLIASLL